MSVQTTALRAFTKSVFEMAAEAFASNASPVNWKNLETSMWAHQCAQQLKEDRYQDFENVPHGKLISELAAHHRGMRGAD